MMEQYRRIRRSLPDDTILFFRLGDFYEMFFDDAAEAAGVLDIALTKRNKIPMCGIPYHAASSYLAKLLRAGKKVALCDQVEDPSEAKGIVRREVTRVVTPGTILEEQVLDAKRNNYLAGLVANESRIGLAMLDLSTGSFWIEQTGDPESARDALFKHAPSECVVPEELREHPVVRNVLAGRAGVRTAYEDWPFEPDAARDLLVRHFKVHSLDGFGCGECPEAIRAAGGVLHYVTMELKRPADHVRSLHVRRSSDAMMLDESTVSNLELIARRAADRVTTQHTLLDVLDETCTPMGGRLLRDWILRPLCKADAIRERLDAVDQLRSDGLRLQDLRDELKPVRDLERLIARLCGGGGNGRDVRAVAQSLARLPALREALKDAAGLAATLRDRLHPEQDLVALIDRALVDEPPLPVKEGGLIREGYHEELDSLREAARDGRSWLARFQAGEQERTGIKSLKVRHNKVFGYYIEVTKANLDGVPDHYVRKQTLVNSERFITDDLKQMENKILGAQDRAMNLEYQLFCDLRDEVVRATPRIQESASALAALDVLCGFADKAARGRYTRPAIRDDDRLLIRGGRHPVIEQLPEAERFVPNDVEMDGSGNQLLIITGPNMAGKSTYIRQVALIAIMAQIGSFVPAEEAEIGLVDRVFTRVGAGDDLARGRSTFMVEMQETANILNNATSRSLIVLDEIGRGTSTFDGISIAWAVAEYLHNNPAVKAKTLFATHYHELTDLARTLPGVRNLSVQVREKGDGIVFLRRIAPGPADKSYGIQVARLAGLPTEVIDRAGEILSNLEEGEFGEGGQPQLARRRKPKKIDPGDQLSLTLDL